MLKAVSIFFKNVDNRLMGLYFLIKVLSPFLYKDFTLASFNFEVMSSVLGEFPVGPKTSYQDGLNTAFAETSATPINTVKFKYVPLGVMSRKPLTKYQTYPHSKIPFCYMEHCRALHGENENCR